MDQDRLIPRLDDRQRALFGPRQAKTKGSPEWCWQTLELLKSAYAAVERRWQEVEEIKGDLATVKAWEVIPPGNPYGSEDAMLEAELGAPAKVVDFEVEKAKLGRRGRPTNEERANKGSLSTFKGERGSSYRRARIERDRPDIAERLNRGEFKSVRAAAVEAGIVKNLTHKDQAIRAITKVESIGELDLIQIAIDAQREAVAQATKD